MSDTIKNLFDVILSVLAVIGAGYGYAVGLQQWKRSQEWKRSEKLDQIIDEFESNELLRIARGAVDWTRRMVEYKNRTVVLSNLDALLALRIHDQVCTDEGFTGEQPLLRDAYDAFLSFFERLELAMSMNLIDATPAYLYFRYWLVQFVTFNVHHTDMSDPSDILKLPEEARRALEAKSPSEFIIGYVNRYGNVASFQRLCVRFDVPFVARKKALRSITAHHEEPPSGSAQPGSPRCPATKETDLKMRI